MRKLVYIMCYVLYHMDIKLPLSNCIHISLCDISYGIELHTSIIHCVHICTCIS